MRWGVILFGLAVGAPSAALADWQNTNWMMTPTQVAAATGGALTGEAGRGTRIGVQAPYSALGYAFEARFAFDEADRLSLVRLVLTDRSRCDELHRTVQGLYGSPTRQSSDMAEWLPGEVEDGVRILHPTTPTGACEVLYWPRIRTGAAGL